MGSLAMKVVDHPNAGFVGHCITYENIDQDSHEWFWTGCSRSLHPLCEQTTADGNDTTYDLFQYRLDFYYVREIQCDLLCFKSGNKSFHGTHSLIM